jgi:hypothetical protein
VLYGVHVRPKAFFLWINSFEQREGLALYAQGYHFIMNSVALAFVFFVQAECYETCLEQAWAFKERPLL